MITWTIRELAIKPVTISRPFSLKNSFPNLLSVYSLTTVSYTHLTLPTILLV